MTDFKNLSLSDQAPLVIAGTASEVVAEEQTTQAAGIAAASDDQKLKKNKDNPSERLTALPNFCLLPKQGDYKKKTPPTTQRGYPPNLGRVKIDNLPKRPVEEVKLEDFKTPKLRELTEEEVYEIGLPLPDEYDDAPQFIQIGSMFKMTNRDIGSGSHGTQVYQG